MDKNTKNSDILDNLFQQMPEEELPVSFRSKVMEEISRETIRLKKRNERLGLIATILGALSMFSLAIMVFIYLDIPKIQLPKLDSSLFSFYLHIGVISLLLLFIDHKLRKVFRKDE